MQFQKNGITLIVSEDSLRQLVLERLSGLEPAIASAALDPAPRIGEMWSAQGGVYAGIARGRDSAPDYHLIVGPEHEGEIDWNTAIAWAKGLNVHGFTDYALPTRKEQALCFANVSELFQERVYWSGEQHASYSRYAWGQTFSYGGQGNWGKTLELRARAVRRLAFQ